MNVGSESYVVDTTPITSFAGPYFFLSNYSRALTFFEDKFYPTAEHAFQAAKTTDETIREEIRNLESPGEAKRMGRTLHLRKNWEKIKLDVMERVLMGKFFISHSLCVRLEKTDGKKLIEGNTWNDRYWGAVWEGEQWRGDNHLGRLLMKLRDEKLWRTG